MPSGTRPTNGAGEAGPGPDDFLSGTRGQVVGPRLKAQALTSDLLDRGAALLSLQGPRLARAATTMERRRVLALAVERSGEPNLLAAAYAELLRSRHHVDFVTREVAGRGKFENLNRLIEEHPPWTYDWLLVLDDDVALPRGFLDRFLFLAERFELRLAQPAHRHRSHAAWSVTRRRRGVLLRETAFVEIGPVTAFRRSTFEKLLPFPPSGAGWGLDVHWSAVAGAEGWRLGVVDATAVAHGLRPVASGYDGSSAIAEAREFLRGRPYVTAKQAQRTLATHRSWAR